MMHYDVFISYSRKDYADVNGNIIPGNEVSKIMGALSKAGISYWFDKEGIIHGEDFGEKILQYIKESKIFVYLSTAAANDSEWTRKEIASAVMYKKKIIPVRIDDSPYHDSVMFRIADLDYINYVSNPRNGREQLVDSILRFKAEEQAAAARREAEEQRRRDELERQHRQQEELRRRQQQAEELRAEISRTEEECSSLEKAVLKTQHELGVVSIELETKRKHLEEQKQQMNSILYNDVSSPESQGTVIKPTVIIPADDTTFMFKWRTPIKSTKEMLLKIKETMIKRNWIVNTVLSLSLLGIISILIAELYMEMTLIFIPLTIVVVLSFYAISQLLLNKRSGIVLLLLAPILVMPILYLSEVKNYNDYRKYFSYFGYYNDYEPLNLCLILTFCCYATIACLLIFLLVRKNGKSASRLLEGKAIHAFQLYKHPFYYLFFFLLLVVVCMQFDY